MDIVIVANFCMDFSESDNGRFSYLANMLSMAGNDVEIITSDFYHITKKWRSIFPNQLRYKVSFIHEPGYPRNVCLQRFRSHYVWGKNVFKYFQKRKKPDVVYCAVPSLTGPNLLAKYCEKHKIRFVIDIQDLWPESFQMVFDIPVLSQIGFTPFRKLANGIYKRADGICAVSHTYVKRALSVNNKCSKGIAVYLGTELDTFDKNVLNSHVMASEKKPEEIWIAYCGTLGSSYDLTVVIDAIAYLQDKRIKLIIMGDGPRMEEFRKRAEEKKLPSVFTGRLPYEEMCSVLSACDIAVNPITHNAAQSIINKHADYVAAGLPIVSTQENVEFQKLIDDYQMGYNCENGNIADVARSIKYLVDNNKLRKQMGKNARQCAEERFDRKTTYKRLAAAIMG